MGAFQGASAFFNKPLTELAKDYGYGQDNIYVLEGDTARLQAEFPEIYQNILTCAHQRDHRSPMDYARDVVASWIVEDSFLQAFRKYGLTAELGGADHGRKLLATMETSSSSDFQLTWNGVTRRLELVNDYTGFWESAHKLHLRDDKIDRLRAEKGVLLGVACTSNKFLLLDFSGPVEATYIRSHKPYGYKPAYEIAVSEAMLRQPADSAAIISAVKELFG